MYCTSLLGNVLYLSIKVLRCSFLYLSMKGSASIILGWSGPSVVLPAVEATVLEEQGA